MRDRFFKSCNPVAKRFLCALFILVCFASAGQTGFAQQKGIPVGTPCCGQRGVLRDQAIKRVEPVYPFWARFVGVKGPVVVEITIDEKGDVINARPLSGHKMLRKAASDAAMQWKFKPTLLDGKPVKVIGSITLNFPPQKDKEENKSDQADKAPPRPRNEVT